MNTSQRRGLSPRADRRPYVPPPADREEEMPLPTGPCMLWPSDATVVSASVAPDDWPEWTDEVRLSPRGREG
jgi:hypothetical protein